jgi:hypothetical protein
MCDVVHNWRKISSKPGSARRPSDTRTRARGRNRTGQNFIASFNRIRRSNFRTSRILNKRMHYVTWLGIWLKVKCLYREEFVVVGWTA